MTILLTERNSFAKSVSYIYRPPDYSSRVLVGCHVSGCRVTEDDGSFGKSARVDNLNTEGGRKQVRNTR